MSKTILYLRTDLTSKKLIAGGSVSHTVGVINGFKELGYSVVCASSCMEDVLRSTYLQELRILNLPSWLSFIRWKLNSLVSNIFFFFQILPLTKKHTYECIYQRYSILNCVGVVLSKVRKLPLILEYNGSEVWVEKNWSPQKWFKLTWLIGFVERINLRYASMVVVVSQALKDDLIQRDIPAEKIIVNPNGVDTRLYDPARLVNERAELRKKFSLEDRFVFGFIGTFSQWHGIELLADMIPQVYQQNTNAHFLLIGDGPLKEFLHDRVSAVSPHAVTFIETVPALKAREYLAACDAFLCPTQPNKDGSPFFGSPTKVFEYMSMAKPIIATNIGQLSELLGSGDRGFLVEPTPDSFVQAVCSLIGCPLEHRNWLGHNAREKVSQTYTWLHHVQHIVHSYRSLGRDNNVGPVS